MEEGVLADGLHDLELPRVFVWGVQAVVFSAPGGSGGAGGRSPSVMIDVGSPGEVKEGGDLNEVWCGGDGKVKDNEMAESRIYCRSHVF